MLNLSPLKEARAKRNIFYKHVETNEEKAQRKIQKLKIIQKQLLEGTDIPIHPAYEHSSDILGVGSKKYLQVAKCLAPKS